LTLFEVRIRKLRKLFHVKKKSAFYRRRKTVRGKRKKKKPNPTASGSAENRSAGRCPTFGVNKKKVAK